MHREHHRWESPALERSMEVLWYGNWGRPLLMFPTSHGSVTQNEDFGLVGSLADKIDAGEMQICCIDTIDQETWYNDMAHPADRAKGHDRYDHFLASELIPFIRNKAGRDDIMIYGASFGAYHAVNFSFRHPEMVSRCIAFSGVFDIHQFLDGYWDDTCYFHCPTAYVPNWNQEWVDRAGKTGIVLATGENDHLVQKTRDFAGMLQSKGVTVEHEIWQGVFGHDWPFWREHLRRFVP